MASMGRGQLLHAVALFALGVGVAAAVSSCGNGAAAGAVSSGLTRTLSGTGIETGSDAVSDPVTDASETDASPPLTEAVGPATVTHETTVTNESTVIQESTVTNESTVTHESILQQTVTAPSLTIVPATTAAASSDTSTDTWLWVLLALAVVAVAVIAIVALLRRRGGNGVSNGERQQRLDAAVGTWTAQGWSIEREADDGALLANGRSRMLVNVDASGHISTNRLADAPS